MAPNLFEPLKFYCSKFDHGYYIRLRETSLSMQEYNVSQKLHIANVINFISAIGKYQLCCVFWMIVYIQHFFFCCIRKILLLSFSGLTAVRMLNLVTVKSYKGSIDIYMFSDLSFTKLLITVFLSHLKFIFFCFIQKFGRKFSEDNHSKPQRMVLTFNCNTPVSLIL